MRDAFGGIVNIAIIVVFLVLVSGYLAFNVNYTKAFRAKNYIISKFEEYEGKCTLRDSECYKKIKAYTDSLGYDTGDSFKVEDDSYKCPDAHGMNFCYQEVIVGTSAEGYTKKYYKIVTQINIDIPIINRILPNLRLFQVTGSTKQIVERN